METGEKKIAVLIDADNVSADYLSFIFDEVSNHGAPTIKRIYGDFTNARLIKWKSVLLDYSITPIQQYSYTTGKNATDSALIIDAMDILYAQNVDGFCIVSSDSDFTRLAARLREAGKFVIGMGEKKTPPPFVNACEQFKYLEVLKDAGSGMGQEAAQPKAHTPHIQTSSPSRTALEKAISSILNDVSDADGWASLGTVGQRLNTRYSAFDSRNYGYSKLSQLVDSFNRFDVQARKMPNQHEAQTFIRFSANKGKQQKTAGRLQNPSAQKPQQETRGDKVSKKRTADRPMRAKEPRRHNDTFVSDEDFLIPVQEDVERFGGTGDFESLDPSFESVSFPVDELASEAEVSPPRPSLPEMPQAPFRLSDYPDLFGDLNRLSENELLEAMLAGTGDRRGKADRISEPAETPGARAEKRSRETEAPRAGELSASGETAPAARSESVEPQEKNAREQAVDIEKASVVQDEPTPSREPEQEQTTQEPAVSLQAPAEETARKTVRRGRKKATEEAPSESSPAEQTAAEPVKPGRRGRKKATEETAAPEKAETSADEAEKKPARRGRKKATEEPASSETAEVSAEEAEKKPARRGRKKATEETAVQEPAAPPEEAEKKPARRGRKKAAEETASPETAEVSAEEAEKKPARRGRKKATEETAAKEPEVSAEEAEKKPARRGRKKATEETAAQETEAPAEEAEKKPARRGRKKAAEESAAAQTSAEEPVKKPVRRGRKKAAEESGVQESAETRAEEAEKKPARRGRRKVSEETAAQENAASAEEPAKKPVRRGRRKAAETAPTEAGSEEIQ